ncbi:MAG: HPF/RaiA family ribosome-associated protein [Planctomycetes bacterium]|nr:HPF/RaiA family ribosome-associated protein [Planctomycetota bacterium]MCB9910402.1 HPF/RaiA family ribosome-associated protein [Planctomycetota bacterium]HPF13796.1 HPF/RaiA family ribosome-associated protein [Planctomycetota bacterium]HRV79836.1 HPF/RaiA family ribosome-associated protein [Planctomycetota bacterium]
MRKQISILSDTYPADTRGLIESRLDSMHLFGNRLDTVTARLVRDHESHAIELVAGAGRDGTLVARSKTTNLMQALDEAIDRLTAQLRKLHDRRVDRHRGH